MQARNTTAFLPETAAAVKTKVGDFPPPIRGNVRRPSLAELAAHFSAFHPRLRAATPTLLRHALNRLNPGDQPAAVCQGVAYVLLIEELLLRLVVFQHQPKLVAMSVAAPAPSTLAEFLSSVMAAQEAGSYMHVFRGQSRTRAEWPLVTKAARICGCTKPLKPLSGHGPKDDWRGDGQTGYDLPRDMRLFTEWRHQSAAIGSLPPDPWEQLALAQHYGLATRLLDWTSNALVALFFACHQDHDRDGVVVAHHFSGWHGKLPSFEEVAHVIAYQPRPFDRRIAAQQGLFTFHPNIAEPVAPLAEIGGTETQEMVEIPIFSDHKHHFMKALARVGVSHATLFPDFEGLAAHLNYMHQPVRTLTMKFRTDGI